MPTILATKLCSNTATIKAANELAFESTVQQAIISTHYATVNDTITTAFNMS